MASFPVRATTRALSHPPVGEAGVVTVTEEAEAATTAVAADPKSTWPTDSRLAPVSVTTVPPPAGPASALIPVTAGQASTGVTRSGKRAEATGDPSPLARSYP